MNPYQGFRAARFVLLLLLALEFVWLASARPMSRRFRFVVLGLSLAAAVAYPNFGFFHVRWGHIHYWDSFHYFMGAKYLPELGYSRLYEATYVAGRELGAFASITVLRDPMSYALREASSINAAAVRARFSGARWQAFKRDLAFFGPPIDQWDHLFLDHGYNDPVPRAVLLHMVVRRLPASAATVSLLTSLDYLLIITAFAVVSTAFGVIPAALTLTFFSLSFFGRFDFIGGSILRWDWIAAILTGAALYARGFGLAAGVMFGYAVLARLFPILFLVPLAVKWVQARLNRTRDDVLTRCLGGAGALVVLVTGGLCLSQDAIALAGEFVSKIRLHGESVFGNSVGLGTVIAFAMAPLSVHPDGSVYVAHAAALAARPAPYVLPMATAMYLAVVLPLILRARPLESVMYAVPLVFCGLSLSGYYYSFPVLLVLLPWRDRAPDRLRLLEMALLTATMMLGYAFELHSDAFFPLFHQVSIVLGLFFMVWIVLEYARAARTDRAAVT